MDEAGKETSSFGPVGMEALGIGLIVSHFYKAYKSLMVCKQKRFRQDSCSADGYTTSVYTLSISSATFDNHRPW